MSRTLFLAGVTTALLMMPGCTSTDSKSSTASRAPRQCFWAQDVRNFRVVNSTTVNIRAGRDVYRLDLLGACPDMNWNLRLGLATTGSSTICAGSGLGTSVITRGSTGQGQQRCAVRSITALTPEEVAALPGRERP